MHSSRMHTARSLPYGGSLSGGLPDRDPTWTEIPLDRDTAPLDRDTAPLDRDLAPLDKDPLPRGQTDTCEKHNFRKLRLRAVKVSRDTYGAFFPSHHIFALRLQTSFGKHSHLDLTASTKNVFELSSY